jgi:hypothetical protein
MGDPTLRSVSKHSTVADECGTEETFWKREENGRKGLVPDLFASIFQNIGIVFC